MSTDLNSGNNKIYKETSMPLAVLRNMMLPGYGFEGLKHVRHMAPGFIAFGSVNLALLIFMNPDIFGLILYLLVGLLTNSVMMALTKKYEKKPWQIDEEKVYEMISKKRIALLAIPALIMHGYIFINTPGDTNMFKERAGAEAYAREKYGDTVTIGRTFFTTPFLGHSVVSVTEIHPIDKPKVAFGISRSIDGGEYGDNYISYALSVELKKIFDKPMKEAFGEDVIYDVDAAPSQVMRDHYDKKPDEDFMTYMKAFVKKYGKNEDRSHIHVDINIHRFVDYKKIVKSEEANKIRKIIKVEEGLDRQVVLIGMDLWYYPEEKKDESLKILNAADYEVSDPIMQRDLFEKVNYGNSIDTTSTGSDEEFFKYIGENSHFVE